MAPHLRIIRHFESLPNTYHRKPNKFLQPSLSNTQYLHRQGATIILKGGIVTIQKLYQYRKLSEMQHLHRMGLRQVFIPCTLFTQPSCETFSCSIWDPFTFEIKLSDSISCLGYRTLYTQFLNLNLNLRRYPNPFSLLHVHPIIFRYFERIYYGDKYA